MSIKHVDTRLCSEKFLSISNNDSGFKKIANLYEKIENQVIDFEGTTMIFDEPVVPFVFRNCKNIILKNVSIDFKTPFFFQGTVVDVDKENKTIDLRILDECIYTIRGERLYFRGKPLGQKWEGVGGIPAPSTKDMTWEQSLEWSMWFEADGSTPINEPSYYLIEAYTCIEIEPGIVRFSNMMDNLPDIGWHLVIKGKKEKNRRFPGIFIENCDQITVENVTVYQSSGMALIAQRSSNIMLDNYQVKLPENSQRICSSTADGSHFSGCAGKITLKDCYFENMLDDALNIHGIFVLVEEVIDQRSVLCRYGHSQQMGVPFAGIGDRVRSYIANSFEKVDELIVADIVPINTLYFKLVFDEDMTDSIKEGMVLDNKTWQPEVLVTNCIVKNNRARSLLLQSEKPIVIEHNVFDGPSMNCLQFAGDTNFWYESGFVNDVIIRNNVFRNVRDYIVTAYIEVDSDVKYHHNITIVDNDIYSFHSRILNIYSVDNFKFVNNNLYLSGATINEDSYKYTNCHHVNISNNFIKTRASEIIF